MLFLHSTIALQLLLFSFLLLGCSSQQEQSSAGAVDLTKWVAEDFTSFNDWDAADWQVSADGLSVFQSVNGVASLFCSDFDASGSDLEGEIAVSRPPWGWSVDDDYIGFAIGYTKGDYENPNAKWYLVDWKKNSQTLSSRYCQRSIGGSIGLAISEIYGTPHDAELWSHSNITCNPSGSVREMARGFNFGSLGWEFDTVYQFRFEVQEDFLLAYVNGELELNITGSFDATGSFCYYNLSQDRVRYSGLTRKTLPPTLMPSSIPTIYPTQTPTEQNSLPPTDMPSLTPSAVALSTLSPTDPIKPICKVDGVSSDGTIRLAASDLKSGIMSISLNSLHPEVSLSYSLTPGDTIADISIEVIQDSGDNLEFLNSAVVVKNMAGNSCSFPSIGSILDDDCSNNNNCLPDAPLIFPLDSNFSGVPIFNFSSATLFVEPEYAEIEFNGTNLHYVPTWAGIKYDSFAIESKTIHGDTILFSVQYFGTNKTVDVQMDIFGRWQEYVWYDEDYDGDRVSRRRLKERMPTLPVEWDHSIPRGVFLTNPKYAGKIEGIDKKFLNGVAGKDYGVVLLREDHRGKTAPIGSVAYNKLWEDKLDNYYETHGKWPTKDYVVNDMLTEITHENPGVRERFDRGIKNHGKSYYQWNEGKNRPNKEKWLGELTERGRKRVRQKLQSPCSLSRISGRSLGPCRKALKRASKLPVVGRFVGLGMFAYDVLVEGRPFSEAILDYGQDAIPVWGDLRGAYSLLHDFGVFEDFGINVDADSLEILLWQSLLDYFNVKQLLDGNSAGAAGAYLDPHFRTFNNVRYPYHGGCDMIFVRNSLLDIHIRTKSHGHWSSVSGVAIQLGGDVFEIDENGSYIFNGNQTSSTPEFMAGGYPIVGQGRKVFVRLAGSQFIRVSRRTDGVMNIAISGHGSDFWDSSGMAGKWNSRQFLGRDGVSTFDNITQFAMEWEVNFTKGDPQLFQISSSNRCMEPLPRPQPTAAAMTLAQNACANIADAQLKEECIFDVSSTEDDTFAEDEDFTNPLEPDEVCLATSDACELQGGHCVWRRNPEISQCVPDLCEMSETVDVFQSGQQNLNVVDGCSCALRLVNDESDSPSLSPTDGPTAMPSGVPTFSSEPPTVIPSDVPSFDPSMSPTDSPTTVPSGVPTLPLPSEHPTAASSDTPSFVRSYDTKSPTLPPLAPISSGGGASRRFGLNSLLFAMALAVVW